MKSNYRVSADIYPFQECSLQANRALIFLQDLAVILLGTSESVKNYCQFVFSKVYVMKFSLIIHSIAYWLIVPLDCMY